MKIIFDHSNGYVKNDKVFCEAFALPEGETEDELLKLGYLPNSFTNYWYQAKSCRINSEKVVLSKKREKLLFQLKIEIIPYSENKNDVDLFFKDYFKRKGFNLKEYYINNSNYDNLKVMKVIFNNVIVAYNRFIEFESVLLGLEIAFINIEPKFSFVKDSILLLSNYGKTQNKNLLYIYESYKDYFPYKLEITGCEFWEGEKWVNSSIYNND
jgi:hypothetical protein